MLIPTLVLLFGVNVKLAGNLSMVVGLPTMIVGISCYMDRRGLELVRANMRFVPVMAVGSIVGTFIGGLLLDVMPTSILLPVLAGILVISTYKVSRH